MRASHLETAFPFCHRGVEFGAAYYPWVQPNPWALKDLHLQWHRVEIYLADVTLTVDPLTSASGAGSITYHIPLYRMSVLSEIDLCRPGADYDVLSGPDVSGSFLWAGSHEVPFPGDNVFNAINWYSCKLDLFGCADMDGDFWHPEPPLPRGVYQRPAARYAVTGDELLWTPTFRLCLNALFDDGTEAAFSIQSPNPADYVGAAPMDMLPLVATLDGVEFNAVAIGFSPSYAFGGIAPALTIRRVQHYPYRTQAGDFPLYDLTTGDLLPGADPNDGRL